MDIAELVTLGNIATALVGIAALLLLIAYLLLQHRGGHGRKQ